MSTLPKVLVKKINATIAEDLRAADPLTADEVTKQINDLFAEASLGSDYSSCAQGFILCVNDGIVNGAANAVSLYLSFATDVADHDTAEMLGYAARGMRSIAWHGSVPRRQSV